MDVKVFSTKISTQERGKEPPSASSPDLLIHCYCRSGAFLSAKCLEFLTKILLSSSTAVRVMGTWQNKDKPVILVSHGIGSGQAAQSGA